MDRTPPSTATRAQAEFLLKEQKYDEALPLLTELIEKDPSASEVRIYRVLVARILLMRRYSASRDGSLEAILREFGKRLLARAFSERFPAEPPQLGGPPSGIIATAQFVRTHTGIGPRAARAIAGGAMIAVLSLYFAGVSYKSGPLTLTPDLSPARDAMANLHEPTELPQVPVPNGDSAMNAREMETDKQIQGEQNLSDAEDKGVKTDTEPAMENGGSVSVGARGPSVQSRTILAKVVRAEKPAGNDRPNSRGVATGNRGATTKGLGLKYESKQKVAIRESASFGAAAVQKIERGTAVSLLELQGSWAKVFIPEEGSTGYVRKEFLAPVRKSLP